MPTSLSGKTLLETDLRKRFGVWVIGVKDALTGKLTMFPDGDFRLNDEQMVLLVGKEKDLKKFREDLA
jgi:trk system potassium uptake protein TrkA